MVVQQQDSNGVTPEVELLLAQQQRLLDELSRANDALDSKISALFGSGTILTVVAMLIAVLRFSSEHLGVPGFSIGVLATLLYLVSIYIAIAAWLPQRVLTANLTDIHAIDKTYFGGGPREAAQKVAGVQLSVIKWQVQINQGKAGALINAARLLAVQVALLVLLLGMVLGADTSIPPP